MDAKQIGVSLKELRMHTGMTLREFCLKHQLDAATYSRIERGAIEPLTDDELLRKLPAFPVILGDLDRLVESVRTA